MKTPKVYLTKNIQTLTLKFEIRIGFVCYASTACFAALPPDFGLKLFKKCTIWGTAQEQTVRCDGFIERYLCQEDYSEGDIHQRRAERERLRAAAHTYCNDLDILGHTMVRLGRPG